MPFITSEMAGSLLELKIKKGDKVSVGQEIAVVESMKMEVPVTSSLAGVVAQVLKNAGDFLNEGDKIVEIS